MKLTAFKYGVTEITDRMAFPGGDVNIKIPIGLLFYLIEYENRKILVDVGCDTMPGFELFEFKPPVNVLEAYGITREEITDVVITHAHHDHIDAVRYYTKAVVHIHRDELESAENYLGNAKEVSAFDNDFEIVSGVTVKHIGGHSKGSCVVLVKGTDKTFVLCGDECYTKENLVNNIPTGSYANLENSKKFVEEYRKEEYEPIIFHDIDAVEKIGYRVLYEN